MTNTSLKKTKGIPAKKVIEKNGQDEAEMTDFDVERGKTKENLRKKRKDCKSEQ